MVVTDCIISDVRNLVVPYYREPHRFYHNEAHIRKMMFHWNNTCTSSRPLETQLLGSLAILYHDSIYDPMATDNEEKSYELLVSQIGERLTLDQRQWLKAAILATKHDDVRLDPTMELIRDLDLLILAGSGAEYKRYIWQIRHEYSMYGLDQFTYGRMRFIESFLSRNDIFKTPTFSDRTELAKNNLRWEVAQLQAIGAKALYE